MIPTCVFCKIRDGEIPGDIICNGTECFVIRDINPKAPFHMLVIPSRHITKLTSLSPDDHQVLVEMYRTAAKVALNEGVAETGYRLVINQGTDAGQEVDHLHLHLLGGRPLRPMG